jgi:hypothetical protein
VDLLGYAKGESLHSPFSIYAKPPFKAAAARRHRAHAAGCWNGAWNQWTWRTAWGSAIGWLYSRYNTWCGNGYAIYYATGPTFARWAWGPYCITNGNLADAWDVWPTWIHIGNWGTLGVSYPWGCLGIKGGHAVVRVAATGYWDTYDDFGF